LYFCKKYYEFYGEIEMLQYTIKLNKSEVEELNNIIKKGSHSTQTFRVAYILLNCDKGDYSKDATIKNAEICKILRLGDRTIDRVKKRFIEEGFDNVLERRPSTQNYTKKVDGDIEAKLVTLCCSEPPAGFAKWSLRLLADKMVELNYIDYISHVSVSNVLKKTNLSLGE
jgi:transposase